MNSQLDGALALKYITHQIQKQNIFLPRGKKDLERCAKEMEISANELTCFFNSIGRGSHVRTTKADSKRQEVTALLFLRYLNKRDGIHLSYNIREHLAQLAQALHVSPGELIEFAKAVALAFLEECFTSPA